MGHLKILGSGGRGGVKGYLVKAGGGRGLGKGSEVMRWKGVKRWEGVTRGSWVEQWVVSFCIS